MPHSPFFGTRLHFRNSPLILERRSPLYASTRNWFRLGPKARSHWRVLTLSAARRITPVLRCFVGYVPKILWSGRLDSNQRPHAPQACALPGCATSRPLQKLPPANTETHPTFVWKQK